MNFRKRGGEKMSSYKELFSRNLGFITELEQEKIKRNQILLIGCGLGSQIAILVARTGFTRFILCDGDVVEIHNINRQAFSQNHLGRNKAEALRDLILEINPEAEIEVYSQFIKEEKVIRGLVRKSDIIVNMADPTESFYLIERIARNERKSTIHPLNYGFGGWVLVITSESPSIEEILGGCPIGFEFYQQLIQKTGGLNRFPPYFIEFIEKYNELTEGSYTFPQLGIAAYLNSALIVTIAIRLTLGLPLKIAPEPITLDVFALTSC